MTLPKSLDFLTSVRFWKLVVVALLVALEQQGAITGDVAQTITRFIELILGGSVAIRTVDRFSEKLAAAKR